jgi:cephalosporin-C deacetylase-like acetyl esterase
MKKMIRGDMGFRDLTVMIVKDAKRAVDYLESRDDIAAGKVAFDGTSLGTVLGISIMACEERFQAGLLRNGGLPGIQQVPEIDPLNYVSRIRVPVLMVNGRFDHLFPIETSQLPCLRMMGTPEEHKRHVLFEQSHSRANVNGEIRETLAWLDKYLGVVEP